MRRGRRKRNKRIAYGVLASLVVLAVIVLAGRPGARIMTDFPWQEFSQECEQVMASATREQRNSPVWVKERMFQLARDRSWHEWGWIWRVRLTYATASPTGESILIEDESYPKPPGDGAWIERTSWYADDGPRHADGSIAAFRFTLLIAPEKWFARVSHALWEVED